MSIPVDPTISAVSVPVTLMDSSGDPVTSVVSGDVTAEYRRAGSASYTSFSATGVWAEVGQGDYLLSLPAGACASGVRYVDYRVRGTGWVMVGFRDRVVLDVLTSSRLAPTTAGRTLDVDASGNAAVDLAKFVTTDTGETSSADGSVAKLSQAAGGAGGDATLAKQDEILSKLSGEVALVGPLASDGKSLTLYNNADYDTTGINDSIDFVLPVATYGDLTNATVQFTAVSLETGATDLSLAGSIVNPDSSIQAARIVVRASDFPEAVTTTRENNKITHAYQVVVTDVDNGSRTAFIQSVDGTGEKGLSIREDYAS